MSAPTDTPMSPAQAAHQAKVSRRTIMRAIEAHDLKAFRDNKNHWKIAAQDLEHWASAQCAPSDHAQPDAPTMPTPSISPEALELAATKAENNQLRQRLEATEKDRDHWRSMAEKLIEKRRFSWPWSRPK
ncbi:helix-turn-helix domain-containing protein [Rhodovulum sulfidophilum]|nr:helix-turn-helix domain-containing protein [Rhodovulum sulfidophilum]